jgi:hypothetical protein
VKKYFENTISNRTVFSSGGMKRGRDLERKHLALNLANQLLNVSLVFIS